jgi:amino acid transporter
MKQNKSPAGQSDVQLTRDLGLFSVVMLGVGAMIGAGVFVLSGMAAGEAGPALILVFIANGIIALIVGCCYAELSAMMPRAGGAYVWAKPALGPLAGFYAGWIGWFAQTVACGLYSLGFGSFAAALFADATGMSVTSPGWLPMAFAAGIVLLLLWINFRGSGTTGRVEAIVTGLKIAILLVVVAFGFRKMFGMPEPMAAYQPLLPNGWTGFVSAMGLTFIAFEGYEIIVQTGEEVFEPSKNLPRAILLSIMVAVTIYVLIAIVLIGALTPPEGIAVHEYLGELGEFGVVEASGQFMPHGRLVLLFAGLASTASALNATIFSATRIAFALGRGGDLPGQLARVHPKHHTPYVAIGTTGIMILIMISVLRLKEVAVSADIMFLLLYFLVCTTVIVLRKKWPEYERPFRVPFSPITPLIGILAGVSLSLSLFRVSQTAWITVGIWLFAGLIVYLTWHRRTIKSNH